ncbi:DUF4340 domain-containing protein [Roseibacillus persicicus]|uniref:DUF4340 domain-containing protein n=1 Tax=Roseibacillus persicicus TaxID=454148 RepID=A0A918THH5_9BACT|nr:DUF4340 domain-containing protein [Roseibacillus persicicus]GHC45496.1 hypothetical protein GCM10007100_08560 [Roseibacillus persicicus]
MSKRLVTILWSIAGLLAVLTILVLFNEGKEQKSPTSLATGDAILKDLPLNKVSSIKIEGADDSVTIKNDKTQWSVVERDGYEADFARLTRLLRSLTEASVAQSRQAGPAFNARFGMDGEAANQEDHGYQITFLGADGKELKSLSIGKSTATDSPTGGGSAGKYVRLGNEPSSVYAVNEGFYDLSANPADWLESGFIQINGIESIAMASANDEKFKSWSVSRENAGSDFTVDNLPASYEPDNDKLTPLKNVLSSPQFEDVLSAEEGDKRRNGDKARQLTIETFEGFKYEIDYAPAKPTEDDPISPGAPVDFIAKVTVTADLPTEREKVEGESEEDAKKAEEAFAARQKELKSKLEKEQAFADRYFLLPDYTMSAVNLEFSQIAQAVSKTEAIAPTPKYEGPMAPNQSQQIGEAPASPATPAPTPKAPTSAVTPPIAIPPAPKAEDKEQEEAAPDSNNSDALSAISEEDIKRMIEEGQEAEKAEEE